MRYHAAAGAEGAAGGAVGRRVGAGAYGAYHKLIVGRGVEACEGGGVVYGGEGGALTQGEAHGAVFYDPAPLYVM